MKFLPWIKATVMVELPVVTRSPTTTAQKITKRRSATPINRTYTVTYKRLKTKHPNRAKRLDRSESKYLFLFPPIHMLINP